MESKGPRFVVSVVHLFDDKFVSPVCGLSVSVAPMPFFPRLPGM